MKAYKKLSDNEQRILQIFSIIYQPVNATQLRSVLAELLLDNDNKQWKHLAALVTKSRLTALTKSGLIVKSHQSFRCSAAIAEELTRITVSDGLFTAICQAAQKVIPCARPIDLVYSHTRRSQDRIYMRVLRMAFYTHNTDSMLELLHIERPYNDTVLDEKRDNPLETICEGYQPSDYAALPAPIQFELLAPHLDRGIQNLSDQTMRYQAWELCLGKQPTLAPSVARITAAQRLLRGQWQQLDALAMLHDGDCADWSLSGCSLALRGDYAQAREHFDHALAAKKKATRKRHVYLTGLSAVWFFISLLQSGDKTHLTTLNQQWQWMEKNHAYGPYFTCLSLLADLARVQQGQIKADNYVSIMRRFSDEHPWLLLFAMLAQHWLGEQLHDQQIACLKQCCEQAHRVGMVWFADTSALLLEQWSKPPKAIQTIANEVREAKRFASLVGLIQPKQAWELALSALQTLAPHQATATATEQPARATRMVWFIPPDTDHNRASTMHNFELMPREQKLGKNGRWTKGRPVALKRLHKNISEFDYLTPHDHAICRCIHYSYDRSMYGYPEEHIELEGQGAAQAAIGHPCLFWADDPSTPVELVKNELTLTVEKTTEQLTLRLNPAPVWPRHDDKPSPYILQKQGAYRLQLVILSPQHQQIAAILGRGGLTVPLAAEDQVLESINAIAPLLVVHSDITGGLLAEAAKEVPADQRLHVHIQPAGEGLAMQLYVKPFTEGGPLLEPGAGGSAVFTEIGQEKLRAQRDLPQEQAACQALLQACPALASQGDQPWRLEATEDALEALCELQTYTDSHPDDVMIAWPKGQTLQLSRQADVNQLQVSVRQNQDWFALSGQLKLDEKHIYSMEQLLDLVQTSPGRFIRLKDDQFLVLTEQLRKRLDAVRTYSDDGRFHTLASQALEEITDGMKLKSSKPWKARMQQLREAAELEPAIPSTLQAQLRDYQIEGFQWLCRLAHWGAGACLADDMGLGKTLQALTFILTQAPHGPTLILAPTSVCPNWQSEAQRFAPTLNVKRFGTGDRAQMLQQASAFDLVICSYGLLQTQGERLAEVNWQTIIADEAQAIKNPQAKRTQAAMALSAPCKIATTGTPIENHLGELWSLFHFINPGLLGSLKRFNQRFAAAIENERDTEAGKQVTQQLKQLIRPFILRRLKSDVLQELPAKTEITLHVELSEEEQLLYESLRRQALKRLEEVDDNPGKQRVKVLAEIMRLRRACCHPKLVLPDSAISSAKLKTLNKILDELLDNRHKVLIFSQFVDHLSHIRELLDQRNIAYQYLDGSTPVKRREQAVNAFQAGEGDVFLISLKAGGAGLNLTAADYVIHMDPWWNPAVEDQASDRAHRIGQQRPVTIYRLVTTATIEEKIVELHQRKRHLADSLLEGSSSAGKISVDDMMQLMGSV